ncbi:MAG TPA: NADH-quinone oxidoreductase subunit L [Gammaproteobacteria bacterium]|nr:NADH-quinone oxidoreductase subunit L [Gammaproteobacteria bacterium]
MAQLLWLVPLLPLLGFTALALTGGHLGRRAVAWIGAGSVGLSAALALWIAAGFLLHPPAGHAYTLTAWQWMAVEGFTPTIGFYLDPLSVVMMLVVTFVGFLIHLYSTEFMAGDPGYSRFFAYLNLFVASMLALVLADNLLFLYLGWEGVGLCSYLLIGFWYDDPDNGRAARKAFVVTRIGDVAFTVGLFVLFTHLGTLDIQPLMAQAAAQWPAGSALATTAAFLLLGGAVGKSAQLPLQTWLPDAMAGPTPVSALIHAATMVTAGVYLIARTHVLFALAPAAQLAVAVVGAATLLLAGFSALTQWDIKRILAYSTISQIGYMFLALGVGAWAVAIFHLMIHAFFKALLFLSAGVVIHALDDEHNIFRMGGLRRTLPAAFWPFLIGGLALSAVPFISAGFYSKDLIIFDAWSSASGSPWLWAAAWVGALMTSMYTFRLIFIAFFGEPRTQVTRRPGTRVMIPLVILSVLSVIGGCLELPAYMGNVHLFTGFLHLSLPAVHALAGDATETALELLSAAASLGGIYLAYVLFLRNPHWLRNLASQGTGAALHRFWFGDWAMDWLYDRLAVRPYYWFARVNRGDVVDAFYRGLALLSQALHEVLSETQTGTLRRYALGMTVGSLIVLSIAVFV